MNKEAKTKPYIELDENPNQFYWDMYDEMLKTERPLAIQHCLDQQAVNLLLRRPRSRNLNIFAIPQDRSYTMTFFAEAIDIPNAKQNINQFPFDGSSPQSLFNNLDNFIKFYYPNLTGLPITVYGSGTDIQKNISPLFTTNSNLQTRQEP